MATSTCFVFGGGLSAAPLVSSGAKVAFLGDSITQQGVESPSGYVHLVGKGLQANGIEVKLIGAGVSGHKSNQMLERLEKDVLSKKPDWMTLSCGVNDVWHGARGVPLEDYKKNITEIVDRCAKAGVKVMILTATPIKETDNENNQKLAGYNAFLRQLAQERQLPLADLSAVMWEELKTPTHPRPQGDYLTSDGVHMNPLGDTIMATGILEAFGLDEAQIVKAREAWLDQETTVKASVRIPQKDYFKLQAVAAKQNKAVNAMVSEAFDEALKKLTADPAP